MNRRAARTTLTLTVATLLATGVVSAATLEETIEETLPFAAGSLLEVDNTNGSIEISVWDRNEIHIEAEKKVRTRGGQDPAEALEALQVIIEQTSGGVRIDTEYPRSDGWWSRGASMSVDYRIQVPAQADLDLDTVNGKVSVEGVRGDLSLASTNGGITVENSGGRVDARTTNGGIDVELEEVLDGEDMSFRTTNGGISLALPGTARASVNARTTNGGINTDFPITVVGSIGKNHLEGDLNGGGGRIELRTTNGGIKIREL